MIECYENETQTNLLTEAATAGGLFAVPASRVDANNEFSTGRLQASIDHGALSYILQTCPTSRTQMGRERARTRATVYTFAQQTPEPHHDQK